MAAPASGLPDDLGHPGPELARRTELRDCHELVVVGGEPEADLPQGVRDRDATITEQPQIGDRRGDAARQLPRSTRPPIVECGAVNGDRAHPTVVHPRLGGDRHHIGYLGCGAAAQRCGQRVGAQVDRKPRTLVVVEVGQQRQQRVGGVEEFGTGSRDLQHHRNQVEEDTVEQAIEAGNRHAGLADPQYERTDALGQGDQNGAVALVGVDRSIRREGFGHLPSGLDVTQPRHRRGRYGHCPGNDGSGSASSAGVQRSDREAVVGG